MGYGTDPDIEIQRTKPDFVVYKPSGTDAPDAENQHLHVVVLPSGTYLAAWTMSTQENQPDQRVVVSRSTDKGRTWSKPEVLDGPQPGDEPGTGLASWSFPIVAPETGRVIIGCNKNIGVTDARNDTTGVMRVRISSDDGVSWSEPVDMEIARSPIDHSDLNVPPNWILCHPVQRDINGVPFAGFTRWAGGLGPALFEIDCVIDFFRFTNWLTEPDPKKFELETIIPGGTGIRFPRTDMPNISTAQEPSTVVLPDKRIFCAFRTLNGYIAWTQSRDNGYTWSEPKPLLYRDGGETVKHPISPSPLFQLSDGRYLLLHHNNDGYAYGANGPGDYTKNRRNLFYSVATFAPDADQPLEFSDPELLMSSDGVAYGARMHRSEVGTYCSMTEHEGERVLWYPDRKHFLLGRTLKV